MVQNVEEKRALLHLLEVKGKTAHIFLDRTACYFWLFDEVGIVSSVLEGMQLRKMYASLGKEKVFSEW
jgi:hypothetical protein